MHIYTILGAALADEDFRELLFDNPLQAAKRLGITLTNFELSALARLLAKGDDLKNAFRALDTVVCPKKPCPFALASDSDDASDDATSGASMSSAAD